jgi:hypothetical protein
MLSTVHVLPQRHGSASLYILLLDNPKCENLISMRMRIEHVALQFAIGFIFGTCTLFKSPAYPLSINILYPSESAAGFLFPLVFSIFTGVLDCLSVYFMLSNDTRRDTFYSRHFEIRDLVYHPPHRYFCTICLVFIFALFATIMS